MGPANPPLVTRVYGMPASLTAFRITLFGANTASRTGCAVCRSLSKSLPNSNGKNRCKQKSHKHIKTQCQQSSTHNLRRSLNPTFQKLPRSKIVALNNVPIQSSICTLKQGLVFGASNSVLSIIGISTF